MNRPKFSAIEYINFLIATQSSYSCSEAAKVQPDLEKAASHDAINRLLKRQEPDPEQFWQEAQD